MDLGRAIETRMSIRDGVTPAMARMTESTLVYRRTLRDLRRQGSQTWNELRGMSTYLKLGSVAAMGAAVHAGVQFQDQMSQVATLLDGNVKQQVSDLSDQVLNLAKVTGTSTTDLTGGLYQTISAFGDTADSMKILSIANQGAVAGMATTTDSVNLLSAVMKGYGNVSAQTASKVSDYAFEAVKLGQTTYPELAASMGQVTQSASTMGVSMQELFATQATLTGVLGGASEVATDTQSALKALMAPSTQMQKALDSLGFSTGQALIKAKGFKGALQALVGTTHGNTAALTKMFGRVEGMKLAMALAGSQSDTYNQKLKEIQHSAGATATAYARATDTIAHKWKVLVQTVNTTFIRATTQKNATSVLGGILSTVTNAWNFVMNHWSAIGPIIYSVIGALAIYKVSTLGATAAIALFGKESTFAAVKTAIMGSASMVASGEMGIMAAAQNVLNAAMKANPIGIVITLIGGLIFAVIYVKNHIQELYLDWMKVFNGMVSVTQWAVNKYIDYANFLLRAYKFVWDSIKYAGISIWDGIVSAAQTGINSLLKILSPVSGVLKHVGINIPASVDFSAVKSNVSAPTWDNHLGLNHVDLSGAKYSQNQITTQMQKARAERDKKSQDHIDAIKANTAALSKNNQLTKQNSEVTNNATNSTNGLNSTMQKGVPVSMTGEQIADSLMPRLERHLYGTT